MRPRTTIAIVSVTVLLAGCAGWRRLPETEIAPRLSTERPVRVQLRDGSVLVLDQPRVVGDSLIGNLGPTHERTAVALSAVQSLDERSVSVLRTAGVVALVYVGAAIVGLFLLLSSLGG